MPQTCWFHMLGGEMEPQKTKDAKTWAQTICFDCIIITIHHLWKIDIMRKTVSPKRSFQMTGKTARGVMPHFSCFQSCHSSSSASFHSSSSPSSSHSSSSPSSSCPSRKKKPNSKCPKWHRSSGSLMKPLVFEMCFALKKLPELEMKTSWRWY